jgi:putative sterol carrier protein
MPAYLTPEWLQAVAANYRANPDNATKHFKGLSMFMTFRVLADAAFYLDKDIYFGMELENGAIKGEPAFLSEQEAKSKSLYIVSAQPEKWKKILQKKEGFVANFMGGKVKLDQGSKVKFIPLGGKAPALIENFYKVDTQWPDEMSLGEAEGWKLKVRAFRDDLKV